MHKFVNNSGRNEYEVQRRIHQNRNDLCSAEPDFEVRGPCTGTATQVIVSRNVLSELIDRNRYGDGPSFYSLPGIHPFRVGRG